MGDIQTRPFSKNYSGLINQSVIAIGITVLCVTGQELMKRRRRAHAQKDGLGSRESWEFGYLYQGRSWARNPSPPLPGGWPLSWVKKTVQFPEEKMLQLRGIDATLYIRFLRGCFWFTLLHTVTTFPILFPIHVEFSEDTVSPKSMTRASISSLVATSKGRSLLWIHICLLFWVTISWMGTLLWVCNGAFRLRAARLAIISKRATSPVEDDDQYYPHPHPQYGFADIPAPSPGHPNKGLRLRTVMVSNVPPPLRSEKDLKEYFEFYMSRKLEKPAMGITSSTQPGFLNKSFAFLFNRAKRIPAHLPPMALLSSPDGRSESPDRKEMPMASSAASRNPDNVPVIERVVIARKMTELASLLERREEILRLLETAHIKFANKALIAVKAAMERKVANKPIASGKSRATEIARQRRSLAVDAERGEPQELTLDEQARMDQLIEVIGPFVEEFDVQYSISRRSRKRISASSHYAFRKLRLQGSEDFDGAQTPPNSQGYPPRPTDQPQPHKTIWEALHSLPRSSLDAYQPLVNLSHLFRGKTVPSIDYYTAKLNLLSSLITEARSKAVNDYDPVSTAFVTFADPAEARRACKYLAVHPNNPLACMVTMAPMYQDLDWIRVMKSSFKVEFVKDWVVNLGVWAFTLFWLFPVSLLVGLVSIQNISLFWPSLKSYLDRHQWEEELIQSFLPTLLVALLALLIPLILLLIAKKAHTITTLSALHDRIMTRYYKFLIVNVLVFFCVGTAAMQSFLQSFKLSPGTTRPDVLQVIADSFPTAGPFYVGWLIFTTAMHGGFEIALLGLPLIMYPSTSRQVTPRKRAFGVRPRTFNFYYWLPNHMLVIHVLMLFSVFNPFVLPFGALYFFVQSGVVKNQLIHVYAKQYEANGQLLLIRIVRYSLDGLILAQAVFLAYMVVLRRSTNVGLAAFLIVFTALTKILITRMCRAQFELDDAAESEVVCGRLPENDTDVDTNVRNSQKDVLDQSETNLIKPRRQLSSVLTWKLPAWVNFSYSTMRNRPHHPQRRQPNPFGPHGQNFARLNSMSQDIERVSRSASEVHPKPSLNEFPWGGVSLSKPIMLALGSTNGNLGGSALVVPHPPPVPWDDETTVDLPYDNPFYTRSFANVLWLPRNPCGVLDLDDTVDLKESFSVETSAGKLGTWLGFRQTTPPEELSEGDISPLIQPSSQTALSAPVDGTEEIDLPPVIAKRVQSKEVGVEQTARPRRPSIHRHRVISSEKNSLGSASGREIGEGPRRPTILGATSLPLNFRSFSEGNDSRPGRGRSSTIMSALTLPPSAPRSRSQENDFGLRPDLPVHTVVAAGPGSIAGSRISLAPSHMKPQNVTASQAIFHEVLAEEQAALIDRIEDEAAETQKATTTKSWLTSWMFRKRE
ncbi:Calcium permeable stress-gated cation channel 1 [Hypsizygus marmoreus]|uniref:Calcium permeable stress-gated cation channel 1 n=1 Tax=Hypsizygus marmoreus TaxID=39966 RepID=A0A369J7Q5_HYPMA|nr:Calcium permeable stress-gated cation channel 1 [Hypsizygus marmoreus]